MRNIKVLRYSCCELSRERGILKHPAPRATLPSGPFYTKYIIGKKLSVGATWGSPKWSSQFFRRWFRKKLELRTVYKRQRIFVGITNLGYIVAQS